MSRQLDITKSTISCRVAWVVEMKKPISQISQPVIILSRIYVSHRFTEENFFMLLGACRITKNIQAKNMNG